MCLEKVNGNEISLKNRDNNLMTMPKMHCDLLQAWAIESCLLGKEPS